MSVAEKNKRSVKDDLLPACGFPVGYGHMQQEQPTQQQPEHKGRHWLVILLLLIIAGAAGFFIYTYFATREAGPAEPGINVALMEPEIDDLSQVSQYTGNKPIPPRVDSAVLPPIEDDEHLYGNPNAGVTMVMYGNLTGGYSRLLLPAMRTLVDASNGNTNLILRNYPLTSNPLDYDAAELGECTYVQLTDTGYWAYVEQLLVNKPDSLDDLLAAVTAVGADATLAKTCLDNEDTWDYVVAQKQEVQLQAKIFVAPSFIIVNRTTGDTRIVEGLNSESYIQAVIDEVRGS